DKTETDNIYKRLASRVENPIENLGDFEPAIKIFEHLLTSEQAELADAFPAVPEELASKLGRDLKSVKKDLDYMYQVGIATPSARSGKWNIPRSPMLFMDKLCSHHRNAPVPYDHLLQQLSKERDERRLNKDGVKVVSEGEGMSRVIPAYTAVKDKPELQSWEDVRAILQMADKITLVDCPCRVRMEGTGYCQTPNTKHVCMLINRDAEYAVDSGSATEFLTVDEAMKHVERMEKAGTIHIAARVRAIVGLLCNCCNDHDRRLQLWYSEGKPQDARPRTPSRWRAVVDIELCVGCGVCQERCFFDAVNRKRNTVGELKAEVNPEMCMGCGSCAVGCPHGAIDMECVRPESWVPSGMGTRPGESRDLPQYANL
ncbi:ATP-binding protein, partial [Chloroflexota bacterium]